VEIRTFDKKRPWAHMAQNINRVCTNVHTLFQLVKKVRFVFLIRHGPQRTAAPTGWFLAVIYVIMVKNTITRRIFRRKSGETAPQRGAKLSKRTQRHAVTRFFDSLK